MFNYSWMLRKFKRYCEKGVGDSQRLYDSIIKIIPDKHKINFAVDVLEFNPLVVDLDKLNSEVIKKHDIANCVRLLQGGWFFANNIDKVLEKIAYYGDVKQCYDVLRCFDVASKCEALKCLKTDNEKGLRALYSMYLIDTKVLASKNAKYNYDIASMIFMGDLTKYIKPEHHLDAVLESGSGEYIARVLREGGRLKLTSDKVDEAVNILCEEKYPSQFKSDALISLDNLDGNQSKNFLKLYHSIIDKGNPLFVYALRKSSKYSKKRDEALAYLESRQKEYSDMDLKNDNTTGCEKDFEGLSR